MKFLIFTQPDDAHAVMVQLALETLGHEVRLWFSADQPSQLAHSISIDLFQTHWESSDHAMIQGLSEYDVVWHRRAQRPRVPKQMTHPDDYLFVWRENQVFFDALTTLLSTQAWWVNTLTGVRRANSKLLQLHLAKMCGLKIPPTLCSNAPEDIRAFLKMHEDPGVIYKPLCSTLWVEGDHIKALYTAVVDETQLPDDAVLQLTPGIFQPHIAKQYELRITCFGSHCVAVKLDSQRHESGKVDWRAMPEQELHLSIYTLPQHVEFKLQALMRRLGLVFGCVDMIVTPTGEYVFLEINEQGQFLWIEELNPTIQLLDRFIQFLLNRSFYFNWSANDARIELSTFRLETQTILGRNSSQHVSLPREGQCIIG